MKTLQSLRNELEQEKGRRNQIQEDIKTLKKQCKLKQKELRNYEKAKEVVRQVALVTQNQLCYHINDITSLALGAVFPAPYELGLEFVERRNKTECDVFFRWNEIKIDPLTASGGGAVDVAAFALRIASWSLLKGMSRNTIIMDEPMRFVSEEYKDKASWMMKEVSEKLGIQFIMVTHEPKLTSAADKIIETRMKNKVTKINSDE